jgi:gamma-butyrobetaine dioxygenase
VAPVFSLNGRNEIHGIRWNDRSLQRPSNSAHIDDVYRAMRVFASIANEAEMAITFRLELGACIIFDNTRLLHSRTAFLSGGTRRLQGAYADLDTLTSTPRLLGEDLR